MVIVDKAGLGTLLGLTQMDALLLRMMRLLDFTTITFDMGRSLLSLESTVLSLCNLPTFLGDQGELSVCKVVSAGFASTGVRQNTSMATSAYTVTLEA